LGEQNYYSYILMAYKIIALFIYFGIFISLKMTKSFQDHRIRRKRAMRKLMQTTLLTAFVVLVTTSFSYAQYSVTGDANFPFFHLGCLIVGGLIIISLKRKYTKLYMSEAIGSFALYALLVSIFTAPVVDALKNLIN